MVSRRRLQYLPGLGMDLGQLCVSVSAAAQPLGLISDNLSLCSEEVTVRMCSVVMSDIGDQIENRYTGSPTAEVGVLHKQ